MHFHWNRKDVPSGQQWATDLILVQIFVDVEIAPLCVNVAIKKLVAATQIMPCRKSDIKSSCAFLQKFEHCAVEIF
jgi:hypothetical protein